MKCLFLCPNLRALFWAWRLSGKGPTAGEEGIWRGAITPRRAWPVFPLGEYFSASVRGFRTSDPRLPRAEWAGIGPRTQSRVSPPPPPRSPRARSLCFSAQEAWRWGVRALGGLELGG